MQLCLLLKNIEKVAAEAIEPVVVGCHAGNGRVDCGGLKGVFNRFVLRRSRGEDNLDKGCGSAARIVMKHWSVSSLGVNAQGSHARQVQNSRQGDIAILRDMS